MILPFLLLIMALPFYSVACMGDYGDPSNIAKEANQDSANLPVNSTEDELEENRSPELWIDDILFEEPDSAKGGPGNGDFTADDEQLHQHDPQTIALLDSVIEAWIEQWAADNPDRNRYDYYWVDAIDQYEVMVFVGMCCSEPEYLLEYELFDGQWLLNQVRATPHSGYDMIREIGNSLEKLIELYGSPNKLIETKESGSSYYSGDYYYYYDHLMTGFIVGGEQPLVQGVELIGYYYCLSIAPGYSPKNLKDKLGEPSLEGYCKQAEKEGYPVYVRYYQYPDIAEHLQAIQRYGLLDHSTPDFEGYLAVYVFSESEYSAVQTILATTKPLQ